jgi:dihydrodipicolinate synthase/N-acetylneuraminate lyase
VTTSRPYKGVFPILPTTFDEDGRIDDESQLRAVDFFLQAGVSGFGILANYSEQNALADAERADLTRLILGYVAGRVPVIVTTSHFSTRVAVERSREAQDLGAAMVMLMPPFHGTIRPDETGIYEFFATLSRSIDIPIMIQDSPVSGVNLSAAFLARLATDVRNVKYFKIEVPGTTVKIRELLRLAGPSIEGAFDGEEGITLIHDLVAGATGTMPGGMIPDLFREVFDLFQAGKVPEATEGYERLLPLVVYENKLGGFRATKALLKEAGIICCEAARAPTPAYLPPEVRAGLIESARRLNPLALRSR